MNYCGIFKLLILAPVFFCNTIQSQQHTVNTTSESYAADPNTGRNPSFRNVKKAKIIISQSYGKAGLISLPVRETMATILQYAGITEDSVSYDMMVKIQVTGNPIGGNYVGDYNSTGIWGYNYTGASLYFTVTFEATKGEKFSEQFNEYTPLLQRINKNYYANDAPFYETFNKALHYLVKSIYKPLGIKPIVSILKDEDIIFHNAAALALCEIKDNRVFDSLIELLKDPTGDIRQAAIEALVNFKNNRITELLITMLNDPDREVVIEAIHKLRDIKDSRAVGPLIEKMNDPDEYVCYAAVYALNDFKDNRTVEPMIAELKKPGSRIKSQVVDALGNLNDKRAVLPLIDELKKENSDIKIPVIDALGKLKDKRAIEPIILTMMVQNYLIRKSAIKALRSIDPDWKKTDAAMRLDEYDKNIIENKKRKDEEEKITEKNSKDYQKRWVEVDKITDQGRLADLAFNDKNPVIRYAVLEKITDRTTLINIVNTATDTTVRSIAKDIIFRRILGSIIIEYNPILFFESDFDAPAKEQRAYKTEFTGSHIRFINWEIDLHFDAPGYKINFGIEAIWTDSTGHEIAHQNDNAIIEAGWTTIWHCDGWGNRTAGAFWKPGIYFTELKIRGISIGKSSFKVI